MKIKEIKPFTVLYHSVRTDIAGLNKFVRVVARKLYQQAAIADLEITGPIYWLYYGFDGKPETKFTLEVGLPVQEEKGYKGNYQFKRTDLFLCASITHQGSWYELPQAYQALAKEIIEAGHTFTGNNREIYINMDFNSQENNITEIQMGIE